MPPAANPTASFPHPGYGPGERLPRLHEVLTALSFALDLTEGAVQGHALRSCLLAQRMAAKLGIPEQERADLYYATLMKDAGCSSNAARVCQIVGGDDRAVKAGIKLADWTKPLHRSLPALRLLWREVLPGAPPLRKLRRMLHLGRYQHQNNRAMFTLRCDRGATIALRIGLSSDAAAAVRHLDEHWDGSGYPYGLRGEEIPLPSRLMSLAQHLDAFCREQGPRAALDVMMERKGRWFDPKLTRIAWDLAKSGELWRHCDSAAAEQTHAAVLDLRPAENSEVNPSAIDRICEAFSEIIDAKSPFTYRHSQGVTEAAMMIGAELGLAPRGMQTVRRAALLHDVGKLSIPNSILDKPGKLTAAEFDLVKAHPRLSRDILDKVPAVRDIAKRAGDHHEKLDGSGYPNHLGDNALPLEARLIAVADVYSALSEERPYRRALTNREVFAIMEKDVPHKLDGTCYEALRSALELREPSAANLPPEQIPLAALLADGSQRMSEQASPA